MCSSRSSPVGDDQFNSLGGLRLGMQYYYANKDLLQEESKEITARDAVDRAHTLSKRFHTFTIMADVALGKRWGIGAALPVISHKSRHLFAGSDAAVQTIDRTKLGDMPITVRYGTALSLFGADGTASLSAGFTIPVSGDAPIVQLDEVDYTSGTVDPIFVVRGSWPVAKTVSIGVGAFARFVVSERESQSLGDYFAYDLQASAMLHERLSLLQRLLLVIRAQDRVNGRGYINSGSEALSYVPAVSWRLPTGKQLEATMLLEFELPIYQRMNGIQPVPAFIVRGGLNVGFNLFAKKARGLTLPRKQ